jgi:hypothetical protein
MSFWKLFDQGLLGCICPSLCGCRAKIGSWSGGVKQVKKVYLGAEQGGLLFCWSFQALKHPSV